MGIKDLLKLVNQAASGKTNLKKSSIGFNGYGFVFRDYKSMEAYVSRVGSSKLCSLGTYRQVYGKIEKCGLREFFEDDMGRDLFFAGALRTLIPSLELGGTETLFDVWVFAKTPNNKLFPVIFYYGQSGASIGAWNPDIIIDNFDIMLNQRIFPDEFRSVINFSPFSFSESELELFINALICALDQVPISDFNTFFYNDSGELQLGIRSGEPFIVRMLNNKRNRTWSYSILGSDDAMELNYNYISIMNKCLSPEERKEKMKDSVGKNRMDKILINRCYNQLVEFAQHQKSRLAFIVLGEFIMAHAGEIDVDLRRLIIKYSNWSYERHQFINKRDRKERKNFLMDFRRKIKKYDGTERVYVPFYSVNRVINEMQERGETKIEEWRQDINYSIID